MNDVPNKRRIGVFIDGSNIWHCQKQNKWRMDFFRLRRYLKRRGFIVGLYYFTPEAPYLTKFLQLLDKIGYTIIKKPLKKIKLRGKKIGVKYKHKGNLDLEMGLMMIRNIELCDEYIIMTGDSDFEVVVEELKHHGKNVVVLCNKDALSVEMRKASNTIIYLHTLKKEIRYKKSRPKPGLTPYE